LTVWFSKKAIAAWRAEPRTNRGGQPWYSPPAILTALTLRAVFHLALRQTEGLIGSLIRLLGLDLPVPDHTTLSRPGETLEVPRPRSGNGAEPVHLLVDRRHHIPKMSFKVQNWPAYEAGPRLRGGLTLWIEDAAWSAGRP
jgi:hypothetical protein